MIRLTERAEEVLRRSVAAARRFDPGVGIRVARRGDEIAFGLASGPAPDDATVEGDGFVLFVEAGLAGTVDALDHDKLVLALDGGEAAR